MIKRLITVVLFSALAAIQAAGQAQPNRFPPINLVAGDPTGTTCAANSLVQSSTSGILYTCQGGTYHYPGGASLPPTAVVWPPSCSSGTYVPATNTCVATGTAANPGGIPGDAQVNVGGTFGPAGAKVDASSNWTFSGSTVAVTGKTTIGPVADITSPVYGAVGDGVHDDAPAVRAATAAIEAVGGGTVYLPGNGKTYKLSSPTPAHSNIIISSSLSHMHFVCGPGSAIDLSAWSASGNLAPALFTLAYGTTGYRPFPWTDTGYPFTAITTAGAQSITLTTPADTSHFSVGYPFYMYGGPGTEAGTDGEINWVTAIDAVGGVITLRMPTSKPYTGNVGFSGTAGVIMAVPLIDNTVTPIRKQYFEDISVEGCAVQNSYNDFIVTLGPIVGMKILNNSVTMAGSSLRGLGFNMAYELEDVEIAGNSYVQSNLQPFSQFAWGNRDIYIHSNTFTSPLGVASITPSQGTIGILIQGNNFYLNNGAGSTRTNNAPVEFASSYGAKVDNNIIVVNNQSTSGTGTSGVVFGQTNGGCSFCTFNNNLVRFVNASTTNGIGVSNYGSTVSITNNRIEMNGGRFGIMVENENTTTGYTPSVVSGNTIRILNSGAGMIGIFNQTYPGTTDPLQAQTIISNNTIYGDAGALGTGIGSTAVGGGLIIGNNIYNLPHGLSITGGATPTLIGNVCTSVPDTTNCGSPSLSAATTVPGWLQFLGDGSGGSVTCSGALAGAGEVWLSSLTVNAGATCIPAARGQIIRVAGGCTINGTVDVSAVGESTSSISTYGGAGGGGGGGAAAGTTGTGTSILPVTTASSLVSSANGGAGGALTGGNAGAAGTVPTSFQKSAVSAGPAGGYGWGGGGGGAGGSSGGAGGNGGESVTLDCGSITFGASNLIDASGGPGQPSTANSVGPGGGGGGGVVILRSPSITGTPTLNLTGGPGGSCTVPMAQWSGGGGSGLTTTATVTTGAITACAVGGTTTGFNSAPKCTIVGGGGTAGTCHFTFSGGTVTGCVVDAAGSGYTQSTFTTCGTASAGAAGWSKTIAN